MTSRLRNSENTTKAPMWSATSVLLLIGTLAVALYGAFTSSMVTIFACAAVGACILPRHTLPALALWLLVLIPIAVICSNAAQQVFFAGSACHRDLDDPTRVGPTHPPSSMPTRGWLIVAPFFVLLFVSALGSQRIDLTLAWLAVLIVCVVAPALLGQISHDDVWPTVRWTFAGIGIFLGVLAAAEFLFHFNPWTVLIRYDRSDQIWSVFRARASLGHPLTMSTVASTALAVSVFPSGDIRRWPYWVGTGGALVAVVLSVSRASIFAVASAAIIGMFSARAIAKKSPGHGKGRLSALLLTAPVVAAIAFSPLLTRRSESSEGLGSAAYRSDILDKAMTLIAHRPIFGFGPGTSYVVFAEHFASFYHIGRLENSALQLVISIGIPASLLFFVGLCLIIAVALRRSRAGVAAGIAAFFVTIVAQRLDANPSILALIAPLILCAVEATTDTSAVAGRPIVRRLHR